MCAALYAHFIELGYAVHGEVDDDICGRRFDLVALRDGEDPILVEAKMTGGKVLRRQMIDAERYTPQIFAATPPRKRYPDEGVLGRCGWITVDQETLEVDVHRPARAESASGKFRTDGLRSLCTRWNRDIVGGLPVILGKQVPTPYRMRVWETHYRMSLVSVTKEWSIGEVMDLAGDVFERYSNPRSSMIALMSQDPAFKRVARGVYAPTGVGVPEAARAGVPTDRPWYPHHLATV